MEKCVKMCKNVENVLITRFLYTTDTFISHTHTDLHTDIYILFSFNLYISVNK